MFDSWCLVSRPFWRWEREDYWAEFLQVYHYAHTGLDQDPVEVAVSRARDAPLPDVPGFTDERVRLLAGACRELQKITGSSPFFLPTRKVGKILGADSSSVSRWLVSLEELGVIHLAPGERRTRGSVRSPRYCYGPRTQTSQSNMTPGQFIVEAKQLFNAITKEVTQ